MNRVNKANLLEVLFLKTWRPYTWIILIGFLLYLKTLFFDFTYLDDNVLILDNYRFLSNLSNIFQAFKEDVFFSRSDAYYRPILTISFILNAQIGGVSPFVYHFTNIIIHLLASCLFFLLLIKLKCKRGLALFFSFIFTVHPVLTQAVAWISGRNDSLLAIFALLTFISFLNFLETEKWKYYIWHMLFFATALFTKESAFALILICILYLHFIIKERLFSLNKKILSAGWFAIIIFWFLLRQAALARPLPLTISNMARSLFQNLPAAAQFIGKIILPFNLSVLPIIQDTTFIYGFIAIILTVAALFLSRNKRNNFVIFGLFWFILFLLPSFIRPNPAIVADFIEHRVYLPMVGFIIMLLEIDFVKNLNIKKKRPVILGLLIIFAFAAITFIHSNNFKNRLNFWKNAARTSPHSPLAHRNLGAMYYLDGLLDEAESEYTKSLELNQEEKMAHNNLGLVYMDRGMFKEAEEEYKKELSINPDYDNAHFNLGLLYHKQGKLKAAESLWKKTLEINPDYIDAYHNLAIHYYNQKDFTQVNYYTKQLQKRGVQVNPKLLKALKRN